MGEILQVQEEETPYLSNLSLSTQDNQHDNKDFSFTSSEQSNTTDFFEFFSDDLININTEISYAEDIILCGKLIPFKEQVQVPPPSTTQQTRSHRKPPTPNHKLQNFQLRRLESLSELKSTNSNSAETNLIRTNRSLDYQKVRRNSSSSSDSFDIYRNSSVKSSGRHDVSGLKSSRWCLLTFGLVKLPPDMDLHDIKNRKVRRNSGTMFPAYDGGDKVPVNRSYRRSSWGLLRVLSCKDHASVAVTTSFGCMPSHDPTSRDEELHMND